MKRSIYSWVLFFIICFTNSALAQSSLDNNFSKLSKYIEQKDVQHAERIIEKINESDIESLSDSLKCFYHYYAAIIDMLKGNTAEFQERANHLEKALHYMEITPNLGIGFYDYPAIILNLGGLYFNMLNNTDKAIQVWEEGIAKCSSIYEYYDEFQVQCYQNIFQGLSEAYKKRGNDEYALLLGFSDSRKNRTTNTMEDLVQNAMDLANKENNYSDAIELLKKAKKELSKSSYKDDYAWNQLILSQLANSYASNNDEKLIDVIEELYQLSLKKNVIKSFYNILPPICSRLVLSQNFHMLDYVLRIGEQAKENDIKEEDKNELDEYRNHLKGYLLFQHNQDSVAHDYLTIEHENPKWVSSALSLAECYIIGQNFDKAIEVCNDIFILLKGIDESHSVAYYQTLLSITKAYLKKQDYQNALPFIEETEILTKTLIGKESVEYGKACNNHALVLINTKYQAAKPYLDIVQKIFNQNYHENAEERISFYSNLGRFYMLTGQYQLAKEYLSKCSELQKIHFDYVELDIAKWLDEVSTKIKTAL